MYVTLISSLRGCRFNYSFVDKRVRGYSCTNFGYFYYFYFVVFIFFYLFILFSINIFLIFFDLIRMSEVLKGGKCGAAGQTWISSRIVVNRQQHFNKTTMKISFEVEARQHFNRKLVEFVGFIFRTLPNLTRFSEKVYTCFWYTLFTIMSQRVFYHYCCT